MHLLIFLPLLICHVATEPADDVAKHLMILLKNSIDLQQLDALPSFMTRSFTWNTCKKILDFDEYIYMLRMMTSHSDEIPPMSTDWSIRDAHFNGEVLYFRIHFNEQKYVKYPDWLFEAKKNGWNTDYVFTKGKFGRCGPLE